MQIYERWPDDGMLFFGLGSWLTIHRCGIIVLLQKAPCSFKERFEKGDIGSFRKRGCIKREGAALGLGVEWGGIFPLSERNDFATIFELLREL